MPLTQRDASDQRGASADSFVLNPIAFGYASALPDDVPGDYRDFIISFSRFFRNTAGEHESVMTVCRPLPSLRHVVPLWESPDEWRAPLYNCSWLKEDTSDPRTGIVARGQYRHIKDWPCPATQSAEMSKKWSHILSPAQSG